MTQPARPKTPLMDWVNFVLLIVLAATFAIWTNHDQNYLSARRAVSDQKNAATAGNLESLRVGICGLLDNPQAQHSSQLVAFENRVWQVFGEPPTALCPRVVSPAGH